MYMDIRPTESNYQTSYSFRCKLPRGETHRMY